MASLYLEKQLSRVLTRNAKGDKQFGLRDQFKSLSKSFGPKMAKGWLQSHITSTERFREVLQTNVGFCDTETTGIGSSAEVVEIALTDVSDNVRYHALVKPRSPVQAGAEAVHGISNKSLENKPSWADTSPAFYQAADEFDLIIFYNKAFDLTILRQSAYFAGIPHTELGSVYDPMPDLAAWAGNFCTTRQSFRYMKLEGGHRCIDDCIATARSMREAASSDLDYARTLLEMKDG